MRTWRLLSFCLFAILERNDFGQQRGTETYRMNRLNTSFFIKMSFYETYLKCNLKLILIKILKYTIMSRLE